MDIYIYPHTFILIYIFQLVAVADPPRGRRLASPPQLPRRPPPGVGGWWYSTLRAIEKCQGFLNRKLNFSTKIHSQIWQNVDLNEQYPPLLKISAIVNNAAGNFKSVLTKIF